MPRNDPKHRAKRLNEGLKLAATFFNSSAIVVFGAAFIGPIAQKHYDVLDDGGWILLLAGVVLHVIGQIFLRFLRPED